MSMQIKATLYSATTKIHHNHNVKKNEFYVLKCGFHIDIGILYVVLC